MSDDILHQILGEIRGMKQDLTEVKTGLAEVKDEVKCTNKRLDSLETEFKQFKSEVRAEFQVLKAGQQGIRNEISDRFDEVKRELTRHDHAIAILNNRLLNNEVEVKSLKDK
ncbi:hypothetical protein O9H85_09085 [Paenibacillus filicis]|uniref:Uncharacterized protein n=1 Tax=Paenibacillus gyeongsangnamensis TaxID=3388067 RepID=A0ABT4Q6S0_9BACL|nr:hypothetical protein [Paenibacillus filicis]MCZ8512567.1 hypothetical protein [Paenibacillus filicis]